MTAVNHALDLKTDDLPMDQLYALDDVLNTIANLLCAFQEQPRFSGNGRGNAAYNESGWLLDDFRDRIGHEIDAIRKIAKNRNTATREEAQQKFFLLSKLYFDGTERPEYVISEFSRIASEMGGR